MLEKIKVSDDFIKIVQEKIPADLIQERPGGREKLKYISGSTCISKLNLLTNYMWDWKIDKAFIQESVPFKRKNSTEAAVPQGPVAHVFGTLTVHLQNEKGEIVNISKSAAGAKPILGAQNDQKDIFKAASTDALKKAASLLGIGLELYQNEDEIDFFDSKALWDAETRIKYQPLFDYINSIKRDFGMDDETINGTVRGWSNGAKRKLESLSPEELQAFVDYMKKMQAASMNNTQGGN